MQVHWNALFKKYIIVFDIIGNSSMSMKVLEVNKLMISASELLQELNEAVFMDEIRDTLSLIIELI